MPTFNENLTLSSGNLMLPSANLGVNGNLYFGGITDASQNGLRLFGGLVNGTIPGGFIDVRTPVPDEGLRIRVDTADGGTERMRITAGGNVGIGTANPRARLEVNGDIVTTGDIILQNADCAEDFDVAAPEAVESGTVMVLEDDGKLAPSSLPYDRRVAGVVSGACDLKPGLILGRLGGCPGRLPVALIGRVYCRADARLAPIRVGDLLTTADSPGYAMRALDPVRAFGAVIGKALRPLPSGQDLIPILVALQ